MAAPEGLMKRTHISRYFRIDALFITSLQRLDVGPPWGMADFLEKLGGFP